MPANFTYTSRSTNETNFKGTLDFTLFDLFLGLALLIMWFSLKGIVKKVKKRIRKKIKKWLRKL
jgi:hypothetical protein